LKICSNNIYPKILKKGVKSYPRGVTTNSDSGIESYESYYDVFKAMEEEGLVLNLHGEIPSDRDKVYTHIYMICVIQRYCLKMNRFYCTCIFHIFLNTN